MLLCSVRGFNLWLASPAELWYVLEPGLVPCLRELICVCVPGDGSLPGVMNSVETRSKLVKALNCAARATRTSNKHVVCYTRPLSFVTTYIHIYVCLPPTDSHLFCSG